MTNTDTGACNVADQTVQSLTIVPLIKTIEGIFDSGNSTSPQGKSHWIHQLLMDPYSEYHIESGGEFKHPDEGVKKRLYNIIATFPQRIFVPGVMTKTSMFFAKRLTISISQEELFQLLQIPVFFRLVIPFDCNKRGTELVRIDLDCKGKNEEILKEIRQSKELGNQFNHIVDNAHNYFADDKPTSDWMVYIKYLAIVSDFAFWGTEVNEDIEVLDPVFDKILRIHKKHRDVVREIKGKFSSNERFQSIVNRLEDLGKEGIIRTLDEMTDEAISLAGKKTKEGA